MTGTWVDFAVYAFVYGPLAVCGALCGVKIVHLATVFVSGRRQPQADPQLEYFRGEAERLMADRLRAQRERLANAPQGPRAWPPNRTGPQHRAF